jgi:adenylate kinase family enzyme
MSIKKIGFAISGPIASGKTYTSKRLATIFDCNIYSFSTQLKQFTTILEKEYPQLDAGNRKLLQTAGQGLKSVLGSDIWVNATLKKIHSDELPADEDGMTFAIIDDLRFISEYDALKNDKKCKWYFIYLGVPKLTLLERIKILYPENWKEHLDESINQDEAISLNKYDCIAFSIDHTLKFVYTIVRGL